MKIGIQNHDGVPRIAMEVVDEDGARITEILPHELARLYAELLNKTADAMEAFSKGEK